MRKRRITAGTLYAICPVIRCEMYCNINNIVVKLYKIKEYFMKKTKRIIKITIFLVIILTFITCDTGTSENESIPDPRKDYYGTWKFSDRWGMDEWDKIVLDTNKWEYSTSDGEWEYTLENLTWTPCPNVEGSSFYEDYPIGYKIAGKLTGLKSGTEAPYNADGIEGEIGDVVYDYIFISIDKSSVMTAYWGDENPEAAYGPFTKQ